MRLSERRLRIDARWVSRARKGGVKKPEALCVIGYPPRRGRRHERYLEEVTLKLYLDTANVKETQAAASLGVLDGVTTNPSLVAKEGRMLREALVEICNMVDGPISAEVVSLEAEAMVKEGKELAKIHQNIVVKVPLIPEGLKARTRMAAEGIKGNVTRCFSPTQALLAAKAGAWCVSPFFGRLDDISSNGMEWIRQIVTIHKHYNFKTYVLVASVRHPQHVVEAALAGGHICTMPFSISQQLVKHPLTDLGMNTFLADWNAHRQKSPTTRGGIPS